MVYTICSYVSSARAYRGRSVQEAVIDTTGLDCPAQSPVPDSDSVDNPVQVAGCDYSLLARVQGHRGGGGGFIHEFDTIEGPRAPSVSQGVSLKPDESEGCSPVSGGRTIRLCSSWPSDDPPTDHVQQDIHPTDNPPPTARKSGAGKTRRRVGAQPAKICVRW